MTVQQDDDGQAVESVAVLAEADVRAVPLAAAAGRALPGRLLSHRYQLAHGTDTRGER